MIRYLTIFSMTASLITGCGGPLLSSVVDAPRDEKNCVALLALPLENGTITETTYISKADTPNYETTAGPFSQPFCRVKISSLPAPGAEIKTEVWLPSIWNGKLLGTGNGGYAGKIVYAALGNGLERGYAVANTDVGTNATTGFIQMAGNTEQQKNYDYRAIHEMTVSAKHIVQVFYGKPHSIAMFAGCSTGGYEAIGEAFNYPDDYHGIIAGAPVIDFDGIALLQGNSYVATQRELGANIPRTKLSTINAAVIGQCDRSDGLIDGLISDPRKCTFDPEPLLCNGAESDRCLTRQQITALSKILAGPTNPRTGKKYYNFSLGAENAMGAPVRISNEPKGSTIISGSPGAFVWVLGSDWTAEKWLKFDFDIDALQKIEEYAPISHYKPDLSNFKSKGGKLILWAGWGDANVSAESTIKYYETLGMTMGKKSAAQFARLFVAPGLDHCYGGAGPNDFGQVNWKKSNNSSSANDIIVALDHWIINGKPPDQLIATKYVGNDILMPIERTRPLCKYPLVAKYLGTGDINIASNFTCTKP